MSFEDEEDSIGGSTRKPLSRKEFPDEADDEDDGTDPCPFCGANIYSDGEWCPKCGKYLSKEDPNKPKSSWTTTIVIIVVVGLLLFATLLAR